MNRRRLKWMAWTVVLLLLAVVLARVATRAPKNLAADAASTNPAPPAVSQVELADSDILQVEAVSLTTGVPLTGTLRARDHAQVRARVAGELADLTVREGDHVAQGQVLGRIVSSEYAARVQQAQRQADSAHARLATAQRSYDNNRDLVERGFISRHALATSSNDLDAARADHQAALANVAIARQSLQDTVLRAPLDGQVATRSARNGERLAIAAEVLDIVDLSRFEVEATIGAADAAAVRPGETAKLQIEGLDEPLTATVERVNPAVDESSRSVRLYLGLPARPGLRQGLFVQGAIATGAIDGPAVPVIALRTDQPQPYIQLIRPDGTVEQRPVEPGARGKSGNDNWVAVSGLALGSRVIVGNVGSLPTGTRVVLTARPVP